MRKKNLPWGIFLSNSSTREEEKKRRSRPEENTFSYGRHKDLITRGMHEARDRLNARSSRGTPNVSKYSACVWVCVEGFAKSLFFKLSRYVKDKRLWRPKITPQLLPRACLVSGFDSCQCFFTRKNVHLTPFDYLSLATELQPSTSVFRLILRYLLHPCLEAMPKLALFCFCNSTRANNCFRGWRLRMTGMVSWLHTHIHTHTPSIFVFNSSVVC